MNITLLKRRVTPYQMWIALLLAALAAGAVAGIMVFLRGLVITNLTNLVPWGLWITIDLSAIALSAGAFTLCAAVYLLNLTQFKPMARTAAFIGLVGYTMAMLCLLLDIGRPDRFYYGFVFWNTHSVLWEVTMCVGLYFSVLVMENLSTLADWSYLQKRFPKVTRWMKHTHDYAPYLAVAGLVLSMLHQSSLGATYGVLISRPIWYRPGMAVLFFVSAVVGGIALTTLIMVISGWFRSHAKRNEVVLKKIGILLGWLLIGYLYLRFWDMLALTYTHQPGRTEGLFVLTQGSLSFNLWMGEILFGMLIPAALLLNPRWRNNRLLYLAALILVVGGVVAYRWDTNMVGQLIVQRPLPYDMTPLYTNYTPSIVEIVSGTGIVAFGVLAITLGIKYLGLGDWSRE